MSGAELTWRAKAEANLLSARQRHGNRLGGKKSRNGCSTCRARRVKCDEARPQCRRCLDGGRGCSYEPSPPNKGTKNVTPSISASLSHIVDLRDADRRTFDYFVSCAAPRLAGAWDKVRSYFSKNPGEAPHHADLDIGLLVQQRAAAGTARVVRSRQPTGHFRPLRAPSVYGVLQWQTRARTRPKQPRHEFRSAYATG